jgi:hypothetical protein
VDSVSYPSPVPLSLNPSRFHQKALLTSFQAPVTFCYLSTHFYVPCRAKGMALRLSHCVTLSR